MVVVIRRADGSRIHGQEDLDMFAPYLLAAAVAVGPAAPGGAADRPITRHIERTTLAELSPRDSFAQPAKRDSVRNGAIIGAVAAGAAMGAFGGWLCQATSESGDPACLPPVLFWSAAAAAGGALVGAGVDALFARRLAITVKF